MAKNNEPELNKAPNMIVAGTTIKGDITSTSDIRFDGALTGNLNTKGKLIIGASGEVKGEVICKNCDIEGKIEGKISVTELLTLKATSVINGDINAKRLAIEPGAKFTGNCVMTNDATQADTKTFNEKAGK